MKKKGKRGIIKQDEAQRIYQALFKTSIPSDVRERYNKGVRILFSGLSQREEQALADSLRKVSDIEALEMAARRRYKMHPLVSRFQLMVHLAESIPANQDIFINFTDRRIRSYFSLLLGGARTLYKWVKGFFLLRRAGNV